MSAIQPTGVGGGDEELASIGIRSRIRHWQASDFVLQIEVFIGEFGSVNGLSPGSIEIGEVASLNHEGRDDSVEVWALECQLFARTAHAVFAGTKSPEVLDRLRDYITKKPDLYVSNQHIVCFDRELYSRRDFFLW